MTSTPAWISLGSNLGDRRAILDAAVIALGRTSGIAVSAVSSYRETRPVGGPPGQGPFLNAAARLDTTLGPRELLRALQAIEADLGRVRTVRWGERTLDLDILIFGSKFVDEPDLRLPHPRLTVRRFVLEPLAEIAPQVVDTITRSSMADLLNNLLRRPRFLMIDRSMQAPMAKSLRSFTAALSAILIVADPSPEPLGLHENEIGRWRRTVVEQLDRIGEGDRRRRDLGSDWLVANFVLDVSGLRRSLRSQETRAHAADVSAFDPLDPHQKRLAKLLIDVPDPTLIVAAPHSEFARKPGAARTPIYWPEATDPDAIVAEVVAVCRGIEAS